MITADRTRLYAPDVPGSARRRANILPVGALASWRKWVVCPRSIRVLAWISFILVYLLYASFYPAARITLSHVDTATFLGMQMLCLVPPGLFLLLGARRNINWAVLVRGVLLGSCLSVGLACLTIAVESTSITETTLFSTMNGAVVVLVSWIVFHRRIPLLTWLACLCSIAAALVLFSASNVQFRGDLLAFIGGLLWTAYTFLSDGLCLRPTAPKELSLRSVFGIQLLVMAVEAVTGAVLFGNWRSVHLVMPTDLMICMYTGIAATFLPLLITLVMRPFIGAVTITFLEVLEPIASMVFAFVFAHERFALPIYIGGGLALLGVLVQTCASNAKTQREKEKSKHVSNTRMARKALLRRRAYFSLGRQARTLLACLGTRPEGVSAHTLQRLSGFSYAHILRHLSLLERRGCVIRSTFPGGICRYILHPSYRFVLGSYQAASTSIVKNDRRITVTTPLRYSAQENETGSYLRSLSKRSSSLEKEEIYLTL